MAYIRHFFAGGWATDFGPTVEIGPDQNRQIDIPFLRKADNIAWELNGAAKKIGGADKVNSTVIESGADIRGLYDYWRMGNLGNPVQRRVIHAGTTILADAADGIFTPLFTGLESTAIPTYETFDDLLIIASDSTVDVPKSWDQTTAQNLAGSPPNFAFAKTHKGRVFAAGVNSTPSTLYYCTEFDPENWTGSGSGNIVIDPGDGDRITGLISFKNDLWVFKGPYKGSIHRITGSSNTGADSFAKIPFIGKGLGAVSHNLIFEFKDDVGFVWSDGTIHSLKAVDKFGDFNEVSLSLPINQYIGDNIRMDFLIRGWAVNDPLRGVVMFTLATRGNTTNGIILVWDYRFNPPRWSKLDVFQCPSLSLILDPLNNGLQEVFGGFNDGFIRRLNRSEQSIDGSTAITATITTPFFNYASPEIMKNFEGIGIGSGALGDFDIIFNWRRDNHPVQTETLNQNLLGAFLGTVATNQFTLGTSPLSGDQLVNVFRQPEQGGEFRAIEYELIQSGLNEGLEIHSIAIDIILGAQSTEND